MKSFRAIVFIFIVISNSNKGEDNSPKTLDDKNHQASSQKFGLLLISEILYVLVYKSIAH